MTMVFRRPLLFLVAAMGYAITPVGFGQTTYTWQNPVSGSWFTNTLWSPSTSFPNSSATNIAVISASGAPYTVTANGAALGLRNFNVTSGDATVVFNFTSSGLGLTLGSGTSTISGGLVEFQTTSGLSGGGTTATTLTLGSGAELRFSTATYTRTLHSLTLDNSGTLHVTSGVLSIANPTIINNLVGGVVHAENAEIVLQNGVTLSNAGVLRASGSAGILRFNGTLTTANLGAVDLVAGGRALLQGTLTNTAATLTAPAGGAYELNGGTVTGGTIAAGALKFTSGGGTLSGASLSGDLDLSTSNTRVDLANGANFTGAALTLGSGSSIYWKQASSLASKTLSFGANSYIYITGASNALTLDSATTATGDIQIYTDGSANTAITNAGLITHTSASSGYMYASTLTNTGTIEADAGWLQIGSTSSGYNTSSSGSIIADGTTATSHGTIYLDGNVANTGSIVAEDFGQIYFRGANSTANLGSVQIGPNGRVYFNGTLDNSAATLSAPTGGMFELSGGTIQNGTIGANALTFTSGGGTLSGVTLAGDLALPASSHVYLSGGTSFSGTNATLGSSAGIYWKQTGSLVNKALTFGANAYLLVSSANNSFTLGAGSTAIGDISIYTDGSAGTSIVNAGTISHTSTSGGSIYAPGLTNTGLITANAGPLQVGSTSSGYNTTNSGTITADGTNSASHGTIYLDGNVTNTGTLAAQNYGELYFRGTNTTGHLGTVQIGANSHAYLSGTLDNTAAVLSAPGSGVFELLGGTIQSGQVNADALTFTSSGGTLSGVTFNGALTLPASTYVNVSGGTTFTGTSATLGASASIYWKQTGSLAGKALTFGANSYLYVTGANNTLTLAADSTATGDITLYTDGASGTAIANAGAITHTSANSGAIYSLNLSNTGSITANAGWLHVGSTSVGYNTTNSGTLLADGTASTSFGTLYVDGNVTNTGTIRAQNYGQIYFRGANTTAHLGAVQLGANGHVYLNGTLDNSAATLAAPSGGMFELYNGTIQNGAIAAGALTFTNNGGTLSGTTINGDVTLPASTYVYFENNATFLGTNLALGSNAGLYWKQTSGLANKALTFGPNAYVYVLGAGNGFTLGSGSTATGDITIYTDGSLGTSISNSGAITHNSGFGSIYARTLTNAANATITVTDGTLNIGSTSSGYNTTNAGTITADGQDARVNLYSVDNSAGVLRAQNSGEIALSGAMLSTQLGAVQIASGGHVYIDGTITNAGQTLAAPASGSYELQGGTIAGGTIASGALTFTGYTGVLDGATVSGNLALPANAGVKLTNTAGFTGTTASLGSGSYLYWQQAGTLIDKAVTFASNSLIYLTGANSTLAFNANTSASGDINIASDGSAGTAFTNDGTITHNTGSGAIYASNVTNSGTIGVSAGTLYLGTSATGTTFANASDGALVVSATGNLVLQAPTAAQIVNLGSINIEAGTLYTGGHLTNGGTGFLRGAGTINGGLIVNGGTIAPGNSGIGALTFASGTFTVTSPATFAVELGGTSADQIVFQNPTSMVDIGSGLLTLSLTLLSAPTPNTTYNLIRIGSGPQTIAGRFAGLPNSGDTLSALFNATPYTFAINYQPTLIAVTFTPVPEPETYALFAGGLALVSILVRRRRRRLG